MNRLTLDLNAVFANVDLVGLFIITSGIIMFWVSVIWILLVILAKMR
jgi:hypothetical protein